MHLCATVYLITRETHQLSVMWIVNIFHQVRHTQNSKKKSYIIHFTFLSLLAKPHDPIDPCQPSPCGPNSNCNVVDSHAVCACQHDYVGAPPYCRPECTISSECAHNKACVNQKCVDPCPGTCGYNALCRIVNHSPTCSCRPGYTGDAFTHCSLGES